MLNLIFLIIKRNKIKEELEVSINVLAISANLDYISGCFLNCRKDRIIVLFNYRNCFFPDCFDIVGDTDMALICRNHIFDLSYFSELTGEIVVYERNFILF